MKLQNDNITTPVYLKTEKHMEWPKDKLFYILSSEGLFLCRNHEWFKSCAPAKRGPGELESQKSFAELSYPQIPRAITEKAVGFFRRIEKDHGWEAALILVWNRITNEMELVCPDQKASGGSVKYDIKALKLPQHKAIIGDIHSHPTFSPTPSYTDTDDEKARPGLHIIVGYVEGKFHEIEFHIEIVIDGERFKVKPYEIMEPYESSDPDSVPKEWLDKCKPLYKEWSGSDHHGYSSYGGSTTGSGYQYQTTRGPDKADKEVITKILSAFAKRSICPTNYEVRQALFIGTKMAGYTWCEQKAEKFIKAWEKNKAHEEISSE